MKLTPAQSEIAKDRHRFRVVCCGRRFGKTTLSILEMIGKAISKRDTHVAYIAPTYQQARDIAWQELKKWALPAITNVNESRLEITLKSQDKGLSTIWLRGWESIETLRGQRFDFIVIDEVASMRNWLTNWQEVIRPTLTDTKGDAMFISTPKGFNHFYDLFCVKDADYRSFHYTSYDNPFLDPLELNKARDEITEDRFAQEYLADFRKTEGLVYKEFDRFKCVYSDANINSIESIVSIDWGFTNPSAVLYIAKDYDHTFWVQSEWYKTGKTTAEIIEYAQSLNANSYYADPAEPDRIEEMRRKGLRVKEVNKDVIAGIDAVRELFKSGKLKIHESCQFLINELETYSYKEKKANQNEPEEPIKENDHALDALRYALFMQRGKRNSGVHQYIPRSETSDNQRTSSVNIYVPRILS